MLGWGAGVAVLAFGAVGECVQLFRDHHHFICRLKKCLCKLTPWTQWLSCLYLGLALVVGCGFDHTDELKVMNYRQSIKSSYCDPWVEEIKKEHEVVPRCQIPYQMAPNIVYNLSHEEDIQWQALWHAQRAKFWIVGGSTLHGGKYVVPCHKSAGTASCVYQMVWNSSMEVNRTLYSNLFQSVWY